MRSHPGAIDTSNLLAVCQSGEAFDNALLRELIGHFVDQNRRRMDDAVIAVESGDRAALKELAHAVKGSAALLGAGRLHDLAYSLEFSATGSDQPALRASVATLNLEFSAVVAALQAQHPEACPI
jgi:HPt (histidine-containing phosphotransfer) domain-containing protein